MSLKPQSFRRIVVLTGAGISAESGLSTFRDAGGLWANYRIEDVATPYAYKLNPQLVWKFYSMRRIEAGKAAPNPAHAALVEYARSRSPTELTLVTQNVDVLHQRADASEALPPLCMHGSLHQSRCTSCGSVWLDDLAYFDLAGNYAPQETGLLNEAQRASESYLHLYRLKFENFLPLSPCCGAALRPDIVWFGEVPKHLDLIARRLELCDLFVSIGTSGEVYPAAGFLELAKDAGATTVCINLEPIPQLPSIDHFLQGRASEIVPKFFASVPER
jgi:NAD-dependent deacetylase